MNALIENNSSIIEAQRSAIINAFNSGVSSALKLSDGGRSIDHSNTYNPLFLSLNKAHESNKNKRELLYPWLHQENKDNNKAYIYSRDDREYMTIISVVNFPVFKVPVFLIDSDSSFEKDETFYKVKMVLEKVRSMEEANEREASRFLMRTIERKLKVKDFPYIDEFLKNIPLVELSPRSLVSALRSTYRIKRSLYMWKVALLFVEKRLIANGLNSEAWLVGLTDDRK